jgi:dihydrofolate reductase
MRKVIYSPMVSVDGYVETADKNIEWQLIDEELHKYINEQQRAVGLYVFGRGMYENLDAFWPTADQDPSNPDFVQEFSRIWKAIPKLVFSHTLTEVGENARLERGDLVGEVTRLKDMPGKDISVGGANLAATLIRAGLVDEFRLFIQPAVLGGGTPMFPLLDRAVNLKLTETHAFTNGVVMLDYLVSQDPPR